MAFEIATTTDTSALNTKGNVRVDLKHNQSNQGQSIYSDSKNAILRTEDSCKNVLLAIAEDDNLEESDLSKIDAVAAKYKKDIQRVNKDLKNGEVAIFFNNGYEMTIDFYTEAEQKADNELKENTTSTVEKAAEYMGNQLKKAGKAAFNWFADKVDIAFDRVEQWRRTP